MNSIRLGITVSAFAFFVCGFAQAGDSSVGRLAFVRGEVTIRGKDATQGAPLSVGDVIETKLGKCTILLGQEHVIHLDAESKLRITQRLVENGNDDTLLDLSFGRTRALIRSEPGKKRSFGIRARTAVMGVRGTHVYIDSPADPSLPQRFMTIEGLAHVTFAAVPRQPEIARPMARAAALPESPDPGVLLRGGELVESVDRPGTGRNPAGAVTKLPEKVVRELAREVAPPPTPVKTINEVRNLPPRPGFFVPRAIRPIPILPGTLLPLDPVADSTAEVIINGELIKK